MTHTEALTDPKELLRAFPGQDPDTLPVADYVPDRVHISRRELSLIVERLLMAMGCPQGVWPGVRDYILEAIAHSGKAGIDAFESAVLQHDHSHDWPVGRLTSADILTLPGAPAMLVGNTISNALLAFLTDNPQGVFTVTGLSSTDGAEGLTTSAAFHGFEIKLTTDSDAGTLTITANRSEPNLASDVTQLLKHGLDISGEQWWRIYQPSNYALSQETELSRSHTGVSETLLHYTV